MTLLIAFVATWADARALLVEAVAPVEPALTACMKSPHALTLHAVRGKDGSTTVAMPVYGVGGRGYTPEERCLMKAVARITLPALPADVAELTVAWPLDAKDPAWTAWRDLSASLVDHAALAVCGRGTAVRVVLDLRRGVTRAWLPAWQFKNAAKRRACLTKALGQQQLPVLPRGFGLQLAIDAGRLQ